MSVQEQLRGGAPDLDDFPTLCSVPLRPEWFDDEEENPAAGVVRGTD
ncbi:hypothetical protein AB0A63_03340 [Lentzea sp. NPDC042327]